MTTTLTETHQERRRIADEALREQFNRLGRAATPPSSTPTPPEIGIDVRPASTYEAVTRQMVESLADDLREIKSRLNNLVFMIAGAILMDVISRVIGA
ncbi:MAG TPA: hypothetical protein VNZ55_00850 [Thermomicrobiales bacterium]|nr:hypothetical protein [Thermomicrobiales bacterium]